MRMLARASAVILLVATFVVPLSGSGAAGSGRGALVADAAQQPHVLTLREQAAVYDGWLKVRLEQIVPQLMREEGIDLWLVVCRENVEDPVYFSLVPFTALYASRLQILVFHDRGAAGVDRFSVNFRHMGDWYKSVWDASKMDQWTKLAEVIRERNPKVIGINESETDHYGDGAAAGNRGPTFATLRNDSRPRVASVDNLRSCLHAKLARRSVYQPKLGPRASERERREE